MSVRTLITAICVAAFVAGPAATQAGAGVQPSVQRTGTATVDANVDAVSALTPLSGTIGWWVALFNDEPTALTNARIHVAPPTGPAPPDTTVATLAVGSELQNTFLDVPAVVTPEFDSSRAVSPGAADPGTHRQTVTVTWTPQTFPLGYTESWGFVRIDGLSTATNSAVVSAPGSAVVNDTGTSQLYIGYFGLLAQTQYTMHVTFDVTNPTSSPVPYRPRVTISESFGVNLTATQAQQSYAFADPDLGAATWSVDQSVGWTPRMFRNTTVSYSPTATPKAGPFVQQGPKLTGGGEIGGIPYGRFGTSVALSADGNTALIGSSDNSGVGAAWVFTRSGSTWTQQGPKLTANDEIGGGSPGYFGRSVALSVDGNTALIGGFGDNNDAGAAWVFTRSGSTWTQQGPKLTGSDETGAASFGGSVALSPNGNIALIGGQFDNNYVGAVWVFTRTGSTWTQQGAKLTASDGTGYFGSSIALSPDGTAALIGGSTAVWLFTHSGSTWTQQGAKLTASDPGAVAFGRSVSLSADGNTALISGSDSSGVGAAWVFTRSGSTWTQQGSQLAVSDLGAGDFASSVALSADGNTALIGHAGNNGHAGAVWVFTRSGLTWTQQGPKLTGGDETGAGYFGFSIALSPDGTTALIGAPNDNGLLGAAWVFTSGEAPPDFALAVSPSSRTLTQGDRASFTVSIAPAGGFSGTVDLAAAGLPSGAAGSFDVNPVSSGVGSLLTITTAASTPVGSYPLTITGISGGQTRTASVTLVVQAPPPSGGGGTTGGGGGGGGSGVADLRLEGTVEPAQAAVGDNLTWRITVNDYNTGPATNLWIDIQLPVSVSLVSTYTDRGTGCTVVADNKLHCYLDWLADNVQFGHVILVTKVTATGDHVLTAVTGYSAADPTPADNTLTLTATTPAPPPPYTPPVVVVRPVIGLATITPAAAAGRHVAVSFKVTRSDNGKLLTRGTMICDPSIQGKVIHHAEQFTNGVARLAFTIPKNAKGKLLKVHLTIKLAGQSATRIATFRVK